MSQYIFYIATNAPALRAAGKVLKASGHTIAALPGNQVTHLLLPVPSMDTDGSIKGGVQLQPLLAQLPKQITIIGGNLPAALCEQYHTIDLLRDARYLAENASITAYCALRLAMMELPVTLHQCKTAIIGWGRISQCLAKLLGAVGADVTIAARKETDRAMAAALGFRAIAPEALPAYANQLQLLYNTAPAPVLSQEDSDRFPECLKIDLASKLGIGGKHVIWARGLPGKDTPESSGALIAACIHRLLKEETL